MMRFLRPAGRYRTFGLFISGGFLALALRAAGDVPPVFMTFSGRVPSHPTMIVTTFDGKVYPIVNVSGEHPQIVLGATTKTLRSSAQAYQAMRAAAYAPGSVKIDHQDASALITARGFTPAGKNGVQIPIGRADYDGTYSCTVVAPEDHPDCYVVVLFYRLAADGRPNPRSVALGFGSIGNLKAGQPAAATITQSYVLPPGALAYYFPMVFSRGRELRSNYSSGADQFFHHQEVGEHQVLVEQYLRKFEGADHPAVPYLQVPLSLPAGVDPHSLPTDLKATFSVDETGGVDSVQMGDPVPAAVRQVLTEEIQSWMFLPRLKRGDPVRTLITLPLGFN